MKTYKDKINGLELQRAYIYMRIEAQEIPKIYLFRYLGSIIRNDVEIDEKN